jgi:hypothetical protein
MSEARIARSDETIGACGPPPKDQTTNFAIYAIALFLLAWFVIYQLFK